MPTGTWSRSLYISTRARARCQARATRRRPRASPTVIDDRVRCSVRTTHCKPRTTRITTRLGMASPPAFVGSEITDLLTIAAPGPDGVRGTPGLLPGQVDARRVGARARRRPTAARFAANVSTAG